MPWLTATAGDSRDAGATGAGACFGTCGGAVATDASLLGLVSAREAPATAATAGLDAGTAIGADADAAAADATGCKTGAGCTATVGLADIGGATARTGATSTDSGVLKLIAMATNPTTTAPAASRFHLGGPFAASASVGTGSVLGAAVSTPMKPGTVWSGLCMGLVGA